MLVPPLLLAFCLAAPLPSAPAPAAFPADTLVDVGGHRLHARVIRGERPPAFVLESGGGAELAAWAAVPESIAARTGATVVVYDRAGFGGSELGPADLTPAEQVEDLREALAALEVPRPRILAGHSYGGLMALHHAARHPDEVAGVLLVDAMNPRFVEATGDFIHSTVPEIPDPATDTERALARLVGTFDAFLRIVAAEEPASTITSGRIPGKKWQRARSWRDSRVGSRPEDIDATIHSPIRVFRHRARAPRVQRGREPGRARSRERPRSDPVPVAAHVRDGVRAHAAARGDPIDHRDRAGDRPARRAGPRPAGSPLGATARRHPDDRGGDRGARGAGGVPGGARARGRVPARSAGRARSAEGAARSGRARPLDRRARHSRHARRVGHRDGARLPAGVVRSRVGDQHARGSGRPLAPRRRAGDL